MSWRKDQRRAERGYHHGNLKEALLQAALDLIAQKGAAGFTFADAARMAGVSPAAPYRHFRDRDELLSQIAQRGFEQFEQLLTQAWDDGRPDTVSAFERVGKAYLQFAREEPVILFGDVRIRPARRCQSDADGCERTRFRHHPRRRRTSRSAGTARRAAAAGDDDGAAYLVDVARRRLAVRPRRCRAAQAADVGGRSAGSRGADLSARARLSDRSQASEREGGARNHRSRRRCRLQVLLQVLGAARNKIPKISWRTRPAGPLDNPGGSAIYVNVIYIHNGVIAGMEREMAYTADVNRWRGPAEQGDEHYSTVRACSIRRGIRVGSP